MEYKYVPFKHIYRSVIDDATDKFVCAYLWKICWILKQEISTANCLMNI